MEAGVSLGSNRLNAECDHGTLLRNENRGKSDSNDGYLSLYKIDLQKRRLSVQRPLTFVKNCPDYPHATPRVTTVGLSLRMRQDNVRRNKTGSEKMQQHWPIILQ